MECCLNLLQSTSVKDFNVSLFLQEFNAKLSDFGLAKAGPTGDRSHVSTQVMGTQGYAAPEYLATGLFTCLNDYCACRIYHKCTIIKCYSWV